MSNPPIVLIATPLIVAAYLIAIVLSNLLVAKFGQPALILTAWVLIPFDLVARDILHGRWKGDWLWTRIFGLIVSGAAITTLLNLDALHVAKASVIAFGLGVVVNTALYQLLWNLQRLQRMIFSNSVVAVVDSIAFPLIAFGAVSLTLSLTQCVSKALGAVVWAVIVTKVIHLR